MWNWGDNNNRVFERNDARCCFGNAICINSHKCNSWIHVELIWIYGFNYSFLTRWLHLKAPCHISWRSIDNWWHRWCRQDRDIGWRHHIPRYALHSRVFIEVISIDDLHYVFRNERVRAIKNKEGRQFLMTAFNVSGINRTFRKKRNIDGDRRWGTMSVVVT